MKPHVFREYDIRGIVKDDFTDEDFRNIGKGFGTYLQEKGGDRANLSHDTRLSSPHIHDMVLEGISGVNGKELWFEGTVSEMARKNLETRGWTVKEKVGDILTIE